MSVKHTVIAVLEAKQGKEDELESALKAVIAPSRAEESCLEYRLHKSIDNPQQFIFYENWTSQETHQAQFEKPYIKELADKAKDLLDKPYVVYFSNEVS